MQQEGIHSGRVRWPLGTRVAFRFAFTYFVLYIFPFPLGFFPHTEYPADKYEQLWHVIVPWLGRHILRLSYPITVFSNGSGDTTYDYVKALCFLVMAGIATLAWSILDSRRPAYPRLHAWFRLYVRLALGGLLILYGTEKLIQIQFGKPSLGDLLQTYGNSSPMGLLWRFMGASGPYNVFAGFAETLGGVLVIVPRFATLGALISAGVLINIFALNMCYDVPVKLFSFHLLMMSLLLIAPDGRRLIDFFLRGREVKASPEHALFRRKWLNNGLLATQLVFGVLCLLVFLRESHRYAREAATKPPLHGIWSVDEFAMDGKAGPTIAPGEDPWERVLFGSIYDLCIQSKDGSVRSFRPKIDVPNRKLVLAIQDNPGWKSEFTFENPESEFLTLSGQFDGHQIRARMHRTPTPKFLLTSRGFHWINEYPFVR